jgi:hypothetical protein
VEPLPRDVPEVAVGVEPRGHRERREHRLAELQLEGGAALRDGEGLAQGFREVVERLRHLRGRLQEHLVAAVVRGVGVGERAVVRDAGQHQLTLAVLAPREVDVVGGDQPQLERPRGLGQDAVDDRLLRQTVVLELDVQRAGLEHVLQARERGVPGRFALLEHLLRDDPTEAAREADQPAAVGRDGVERHAGRARRDRLEVSGRDHSHQVLVALLRGGQEHEVVDGEVLAELGRRAAA